MNDSAVKQGQVIEGKVVDFASEGEGIIKIGAYPIFVPFAIKGEVVKACITHAKKDCAFADLIEVLSPSNDRIKPRCPYFGKCGGCSLQHIKYDTQLLIKRDTIKNAIRKIAGIDVDVNDTVSVNEWGYRNKLSLPFGYKQKSNRVVLGFYEKKTHDVVKMKWCALHDEWCSNLIQDVTSWANENHISVYDEKAGKGLLRHLVARYIDTLTITLVINGDRVSHIDKLVEKLNAHFTDFAIFTSPNKKSGNAIMGDTVRLVYGKEHKQNLKTFSAVISPLSFLQVNGKMMDRIYDDVCNALKDFDGDIVELYSGVGLLSAQIALRLHNARIITCEIVKEAVDNAIALMKDVGCDDRVECIASDAIDFMSSLKSKSDVDLPSEIVNSSLYLGDREDIKPRALILDPPRKGCDKKVLDSAISVGFDRIIYVSCNPQTLARDLKILKDSYDIVSVTPYDMFANTSHIETIVCLRKQ